MSLDSLFHHNPPTDAVLLRAVFVNRERELSRLRRQVLSSTGPGVLAIHGASRVGKSHLALHFLAGLTGSHHVFMVNAAEGRRARVVLQDLYESVRQRITGLQEPAELMPEGDGSTGLLEEARGMIQMMDQLVLDGDESRKISLPQSFKATAGFLLQEKLLRLLGADDQASSETSEIVVPAPTEHRLMDFIRELCEVLHYATGKDSVVYVDDIDLLDLGSPDEGYKQVTLLVRLLHRLSESPHIAVLASLRTRHMTIWQKELREVVSVSPLRDEELVAVYEQHIRRFNDGADVFDRACLGEIIAASSGQVGTFLRTCSLLLSFAEMCGLLDEHRLLTVEDLKAFYLSEIARLRVYPALRPYIERIHDAVRKRQLSVDLDASVEQTALMFTLLEEPPSRGASRKSYVINQMVARVMSTAE